MKKSLAIFRYCIQPVLCTHFTVAPALRLLYMFLAVGVS